RDGHVTGVQTCALPISSPPAAAPGGEADARRGGPVPAHHGLLETAVSRGLHPARRAGGDGGRGATPAYQEGHPAARRDPPAPAAVFLVAGARRIARALGRE